MGEKYNTAKPIYAQLAERMNRQIVRGDLRAGEKLPSVRDMAIQSSVNPNTVQRTYRELERIGIVEMRRGEGTFVTENRMVLEQLRESLKEEYVSTFVNDMKEMGYTNDEIVSGLHEYLLEQTGKGEEGDD